MPKTVLKMSLTHADFEQFKAMQVKYRMDWPAVFSADEKYRVFPCPSYGWSRKNKRIYLQGQCKSLDDIVSEYLKIRPEGGRFFISERGAFYAPEILGLKSSDQPIVEFEITD